MRLFFMIMTALLFFVSTIVLADPLTERLKYVSSSPENAEKIINLLQEQAIESLTTEDYLVISEGYQTLNNREAALDAVSKAELLAKTPYLRALSLFHKAQVYGIYYQDSEMALQQLIQAEHILLSLTDAPSRLLFNDVLTNFASAYNLQGNIKTAFQYAERSLLLARELENAPRELNALILSSRIALQNNQYQYAFTHLQQGLTLATQLKDEEQIASIHFRLGMAHRKLDQHTDALEHFNQAADRYLQLNKTHNYSYVLVYLAESYLENPDKIDHAETLLKEALAIAEQHQNTSRAATVYYSLGRAALLRKRYAESEAYYHQALQHFRQLNSRGLILETTLALVQLLIEQQRYNDAQALLDGIATDIVEAATFLQLRFNTSAAALAVADNKWQDAFKIQQKITELHQLELKTQMQYQLTELKDGLNQVSDVEQQNQVTTQLKQQLATAQSRQLLLQVLLVLMIFVAFFVWQLYRRQHIPTTVLSAPDVTPKQWIQFRDKLKAASQQQPITLLVLLPRDRASLQRQYGHQIVTVLFSQIEQELRTSEIKASFSNTEMLWLAIGCDDANSEQQLIEQATLLLQQKLTALGAEAAVLAAHFTLEDMLGKHWHKDDLNAITEAVWFGWSLAERQPSHEQAWQLRFIAEHPRPCEWQVEDVRADMLNACRLGELTLTLNHQPLKIPH
ncbi:tetratricopeptide repeat protein [Alishewanella tabrizica]|uniref:Uncharacterized protein n=1 Tax=Alishewanella tabrizica TaxID=671278 RepID=A0ABQ2WHP5_9ALTE|nr:tetratricopeptide repeat protein [Alishewanella tabrizica]GGW55892.1 hypothetical protein GCM10008111_10080 [Alishewanella tabrizica]